MYAIRSYYASQAHFGVVVASRENIVRRLFVPSMFDVEYRLIRKLFVGVQHMIVQIELPILNGDEIDFVLVVFTKPIIMHRYQSVIGIQFAGADNVV